MRCVLPWLDRWAAKKPDAAAFEGEKTCLTWRQLHDTAKRIGLKYSTSDVETIPYLVLKKK